MIAFGIIDALQEEKYKVPGDVSVLGCDNIIFAGMSHMALTTIEHFVPFKGRDACDIIMRKSSPQAARIPKQNLSARIISSTSQNSLSARPQLCKAERQKEF